MTSLAHIINPYRSNDSSENRRHAITFRSIQQASKQINDTQTTLDLLSAQFPDDRAIIPDDFQTTQDLHRSVNDKQDFTSQKPYPLLRDILDRLYESSNAEYLIFTNMDIILQEDFYRQAAEYAEHGYDAFIINRRRIPDNGYTEEDLPDILQQTGKTHPGFDCFIFHRSLYPYFRLGNVCVGIPFVGVTLAHNLFCFARNFKLFDNQHLTTHLGTDVLPERDQEYYWHNRKEFEQVLRQLWHRFDIARFPYADLPLLERYYKWFKNPSLFTVMNLKLDLRRLQKEFSSTKKSRKRNIQGKRVQAKKYE